MRNDSLNLLLRAGTRSPADEPKAEPLELNKRAGAALAEDLGIAPSPELQALALAILKQDPALTLDAQPAVVLTNLPAPSNALIGRDADLAALERLIRRTDVRVVT